MAETAEQAEMRALKEEVARLKKTRAAVVKALEAQSWDDVRAALAHSESSKARGYSRRGMTLDEKKAHTHQKSKITIKKQNFDFEVFRVFFVIYFASAFASCAF